MTDTTEELDPRLAIGGNQPPEPTPFETIKLDIDDLYVEAEAWLDGTPIENEGQASAVATLIDRFAKASKAAEAQRKVEKEPHLEAGRAVDAMWKPLTDQADKAIKVAKGAQRTWLLHLDKMQREEAARVAAEAAKAAAAALAEVQAANAAGDLAARDAADAQIENAKTLLSMAKAADKAKPQAKGDGAARALGLRSVWVPTMTDAKEALRGFWVQPHRLDEIKALMQKFAEQDARSGARVIPGFDVKEEKVL